MPVLLAVLGTLVTLVAVMVGKRLEHNHWLTDRRLQAYAEFMVLSDSIVSSQADRSALATARGMVFLLGPHAVADAAMTVLERLQDLAGAETDSARQAASCDVRDAHLDFIFAARKAVGAERRVISAEAARRVFSGQGPARPASISRAEVE